MSILLALAACTEPELASDYTLRVVPRFLEGQDVLGDGPEIKVVVRAPDGTETISYAGTASSGTELSTPNVGPLPAGTIVGVLAEASGSTDREWDPGATVAYGQAVLDEDLATGEQQVEVEVLVARLDELAKLGNQPEAKRRYSGAIAMLPNGDTYVFGGGDPSVRAPITSDRVLALTGRNDGNSSFENAGTIPSFEALDTEVQIPSRAAMSATTVDVDGQAMILVAGGRADWLQSWNNVDGWFVWDPAAQAVHKQGKMASSRSEHLALPFGNGDVLVWGGLQLTGTPNATHERFDVSDLRMRDGRNAERVRIAPYKAFGATLGDDVVLCGGFSAFGSTWEPSDGCNRFQSDDDIEDFDPLPVPLAWAAMVEISNGRLLLTGGSTDDIVDSGAYQFGVAPALADAWIHEGSGWRPAGAMAAPRAGHEMVAMADGRVLIIGGTEVSTGLYGDVETPVRCPEIFDPEDESFTELECTNVGQGASPLVAAAPGQQAVVIEGYYWDGFDFVGATEWGTISLGPPLSR
jgi:hypothetical protein